MFELPLVVALFLLWNPRKISFFNLNNYIIFYIVVCYGLLIIKYPFDILSRLHLVIVHSSDGSFSVLPNTTGSGAWDIRCQCRYFSFPFLLESSANYSPAQYILFYIIILISAYIQYQYIVMLSTKGYIADSIHREFGLCSLVTSICIWIIKLYSYPLIFKTIILVIIVFYFLFKTAPNWCMKQPLLCSIIDLMIEISEIEERLKKKR